jgi:hypothetical protein
VGSSAGEGTVAHHAVSALAPGGAIPAEDLKPGRIRYLDVLVSGPPARIERFPVSAAVSLFTTEAGKETELSLVGRAQRQSPARLGLGPDGQVTRIETTDRVWYGVLTGANEREVIIKGWRGHDQGTTYDYFEQWSPSWIHERGSRPARFDITPGTVLAVNRDIVSLARLKQETGRVVEIRLDCDGRARYVDVFKITTYFNFTGGNIPVYDARRKDPPSFAKFPRRGDWAFFDAEGVDSPKPRYKFWWMAPDVKVYDPEGMRIPFSWRGDGFAGVWQDPKTKLITHVFWSVTSVD